MIQFFIILFLPIVILTACATPPQQSARSADETPWVQLLGFEGCPNTPVMEQRLRSALDLLSVDWPVEYIDQEELAADDLRRGWPAPTVIVDGHDLYGMAPPQTTSMGCRMYAGPGGVPSVNDLVQRLQHVELPEGAPNQ